MNGSIAKLARTFISAGKTCDNFTVFPFCIIGIHTSQRRNGKSAVCFNLCNNSAQRIHMQRKEFFLGINGKISTGEELIGLMEMVEGKELDVYWLNGNNGEVLRALVYKRGGNHMMCEAHVKPTFHRAKIEQTAEDRENMSLVMSYIQTINGYVSHRKAEIEKVLVIDHRDATLNRKFVIPGINTGRYNVDPLDETETLPEPDVEMGTLKLEPVEVLEISEEPFKIDSKGFQMKDNRGLISRLTSSNY